MITRDEVDKCLDFIGSTDVQFAETKTEVERASWLCKHVRALVYEVTDKEGKVDERKNAVERDLKVIGAEERRLSAILAFETLKAKRETKFLILEVFRTLEATRRRETIQ